MEDQVDGWTDSFGEFFAGYDDNQHAVITPRRDTHLPSGNTTWPSSDVSHTPSKDDLFGELSDSDLLEFTHQEACKLSNTESIQQFDARPNTWDCVSFRNYGFTHEFNDIRVKIKDKFGFEPFPWQVSVVIDIAQHKKDVFIIAGTNAGKSLTYQSIPEVTGGIVLVISPTIALMEDQQQWLCERGISAVALILNVVAKDPGIWKRVDKGEYSVVIGSPEVLLSPRSLF